MKKVSLILAIIFSAMTLILSIVLALEPNYDNVVLFIVHICGTIVFWVIRIVTVKKSKQPSSKIGSIKINLKKYETDNKYRDSIVEKVHKNADNDYEKKIAFANRQIESLTNQRLSEIKKLEKKRWVKEGKIFVNTEEGKVMINKLSGFFSDIISVEIRCISSVNQETISKGKSKKHASLGGAVVGGVLGGGLGATAGALTMGKTTSEAKTNTYNTPICDHLGVLVNLKGTFTEIVYVEKRIDQSDKKYISLENEAKTCEYRLKTLSQTPVPQYVQPLEEKPSVLVIDSQIAEARKELDLCVADTPDYDAILQDLINNAKK